jgi:tRNA(Ile2) C34 agmatinyltransferase TiaS
MERILLTELNMSGREEILDFLKKLWNQEGADCPVCGSRLELLHKKAKKSNCDWQCKKCGKIYKTMYLLDELNRQI